METNLLKEEGRLHNLICRRMSMSEDGGGRIFRLRGMMMHYLYAHRGRDVYQRDIEKALHIRRSTAAVALNQMEADGFVVRENVDSDKRLKKIVPTEKLFSVHERVERRIQGFVNMMTKGIDGEDLKVFYKVIDAICLNLEEHQ